MLWRHRRVGIPGGKQKVRDFKEKMFQTGGKTASSRRNPGHGFPEVLEASSLHSLKGPGSKSCLKLGLQSQPAWLAAESVTAPDRRNREGRLRGQRRGNKAGEGGSLPAVPLPPSADAAGDRDGGNGRLSAVGGLFSGLRLPLPELFEIALVMR